MECIVKGLKLHYQCHGEGEPILLLHGFYPDHRLMAGCMEPVLHENGYKRIYLDLPGMGQSESAFWLKSADEMLEIVLAFIERLLPSEDFLLAGESYGGYLARGIVRRLEKRVTGLFLLCPCIVAQSERRTLPPHAVLRRDAALLAQLPPEDMPGYAAMAVVQSKETWRRYEKEVLPGLKMADADFLKRFEAQGYAFSFPVDQGVRYQKPTLILTGRQDDCVGYQDAWQLLEQYPRATFAVLDRAGHNAQIEQPELFNALLKEWLARVQEGQLDI